MSRRPVGKRPKRIAQRLQAELARLIQTEAADPRLALVSVTDIRVDRELEFANVWICTADGKSDRQAEVLRALQHAKGFLRSELAARIHLRHMPELIFHWDYLPDRAARIEALLDALEMPAMTSDDESASESDD